MERATKRATYADVLAAPSDVIAEVIAGDLHTRPRPGLLHAGVSAVLGELPDAPFLELAPDWVCEVLSPSTQGHDRVRKLPVYRRELVGHVWLVDPRQRTLEVFRLDGDSYRLVATHAEREVVRAEPFQAIELDLSLLWQS
jgi:Uma2 family endonuclease